MDHPWRPRRNCDGRTHHGLSPVTDLVKMNMTFLGGSSDRVTRCALPRAISVLPESRCGRNAPVTQVAVFLVNGAKDSGGALTGPFLGTRQRGTSLGGRTECRMKARVARTRFRG